jgi:hypothetical protein
MEIDRMTEREIYDNLQKHAKANYSKGWDWIVEGVGYKDFLRDLNDFDIPPVMGLVLAHYRKATEIRSERYDEVRSEMF